MFESIATFQSFCLVGIGAITGSWIRMRLANLIASISSIKYLGTVIINLFSAFCLGLVFAFLPFSDNSSVNKTTPIFLLICVGFLGSLSTFSTFVLDLLNLLLKSNWRQSLFLVLFSVLGGLFAVALGLVLGSL